jgi:beta-mannosidase
MQMKKFLFIFFFFGFLNLVNGQQIIRSLNEALWHFSQVNSLIKFKAKVPGTIHSDLFANKHIPDPFYGMKSNCNGLKRKLGIIFVALKLKKIPN